MKVSERLRELGEEGAIVVVGLETPLHAVGGPAPASVTLRNALPLIADCIEQAERYANAALHWTEDAPRQKRMREALGALEKVLEGADVT